MVMLVGLVVIALFLASIPFWILKSPYGTNTVKDRPPKWIHAVSILLGLAYGLSMRWMVGHNRQIYPIIMSWEFIGLVPFAMGFITVFVVERRRPQAKIAWFLLPWVPVALGLLATMVFGWEGIICVVMLAPLAMLCAGLGGIAAGFIVRSVASASARNASLMLVATLPFITAPVGQRYFLKNETRTAATCIDIAASPEIVWRNIERVPPIRDAELPLSWSRAIGFPAPIEATLSQEGVGGVRHATFARGVLFIENVDVWEPGHRLAFSIHAQTEQIPRTTLDEHVRIGGPYFDVLRGEYVLEPLPNGVTRLHLYSQQRLSTDFNWYAQLWTGAIMRDLQNGILYVIKNRCEKRSVDLSVP